MGSLRAAAAWTDITPSPGTWMTGFGGRTRPGERVHDPITARAVLLDDGEAELAVVSCDLLGFEPAAVAEMRRRIAARSSIPETGILICCTHTHSGPASMPMRGAMGHVNSEWLADAQGKIMDLVATLPARTEPARLAHAATVVTGLGYNRQDERQAIDEELIAIGIESQNGGAIATILNYALHPVVLGQGNLDFSADFPGVAVRRIEEERGGVGLYIQGAAGDVDPVVNRDRGWSTGTFEDAAQTGGRLAEAALEALAGAPRCTEVALRCSSRIVEVPLDPPPSWDALGSVKAEFEADRCKSLADPVSHEAEAVATAMLEWAHELEYAVTENRVPRSIEVEILGIAANDLKVITLPFETYSDIGLRIKRGLVPHRAVVAGCANGLYGYCASRWAKDQGGYGPDSSCRWFGGLLTAPAAGADEILIEACMGLG
jgi:neutral ceramidase